MSITPLTPQHMGRGIKSACSPLLLVAADIRSHVVAEGQDQLTGLCWARVLGTQRLHNRTRLQPEVFLPLESHDLGDPTVVEKDRKWNLTSQLGLILL